MKITKNVIRRIIKEELNNLKEQDTGKPEMLYYQLIDASGNEEAVRDAIQQASNLGLQQVNRTLYLDATLPPSVRQFIRNEIDKELAHREAERGRGPRLQHRGYGRWKK
jgi:hypothetical protein